MKKILLITRPIAPPWDEASKNFAYTLAKNISDAEIGLFTYEIINDLPSNVHQKAIYTSPKFTYFQKIRLIKHLRKFREDYDIFHYIFTPTRQNSFLIKNFVNHKNSRAKTIQTVATLREDLYRDTDFKKILFADLIIAYSDYAKNKLNSLGFNNVKRVYPGIDLDEYKKTENDPTKSDFVINFTGEYTRLGAIDLIIDSFIEIIKTIPEARLSLAVRIKNSQDARKKEEVVEKLKNNNLLEKVTFFDDGSYKMSEVYNLCDISLFPVTDMKGKFDIPLAVVEAMASEKPVILSDLPILSELSNGRNSVIIERGNMKQLIEAILDLYHHPEKRSLIGLEARKFVEERFDIRKIAEKYQEIYEKL